MSDIRNNRIILLLKYFYCITFFILLLDRMDNVMITSGLRKIKYIYLFFLILYCLVSLKSKIHKRVIPGVIAIGIIILHTLLWGLFFVNDTVKSDTFIHMREILILFCFIGGTAYLYGTAGTLLEFAKNTYMIYFLVLLWAGITHLSNFVNPVKFIYVFGGHHAYRVTFGLGHANYVGSICCFALLCSVYLLENIRNHGTLGKLLRNRRSFCIILADIYIAEMLFSTASRTAIIAFLVAVMIYLFYNVNELIPYHIGRINAQVIFCLCGGILFALFCGLGGLSALLSETHRDNMLSVNSEILYNYFNPWIGMGYINYSGFAYGTWQYGYQTVNTDSYYAYIFYSTGYLGVMLIGLAILLLGIFVCKSSLERNNISGLIAYFAFLLIGVTQASLISYDHLMSISFWILFLLELYPERDFVARCISEI